VVDGDLITHLQSLAELIRDGEAEVLHMRHEKKAGNITQDAVNETLADVEYEKRLYTTLRLRAEATIAGVTIHDIPETDRERAFRMKMRGEA
jgi:hypothetical protein